MSEYPKIPKVVFVLIGLGILGIVFSLFGGCTTYQVNEELLLTEVNRVHQNLPLIYRNTKKPSAAVHLHEVADQLEISSRMVFGRALEPGQIGVDAIYDGDGPIAWTTTAMGNSGMIYDETSRVAKR